MQRVEEIARDILGKAGIVPNGPNPCDIQVHNPEMYRQALRGGSIGLGESYMDGWWDCERLDEFFLRVFEADLEKKIRPNFGLAWHFALAYIFNLQSKRRAFQVGEAHYDIGNDLFEVMLDSRMIYTCGYWKDARDLESAQVAKLDLVCRKIALKSGQKILDIGCGWGGFATFAAERYGAEVVGITVSKEQVALAREKTKGLPIEIRLQDYRDVHETFDHIVSLGMFEHVGYKNYRTYMETVRRCLKEEGLFLLHTIGGNQSRLSVDPWTEKYIFPNGMLPSIKQIGASIEGLLVMEDWHNFGADYDTTLMAWHERFVHGWPQLKGKYNERFFRMWTYWLLSSAASFRARDNQLWQIVLSPRGTAGGYTPIR